MPKSEPQQLAQRAMLGIRKARTKSFCVNLVNVLVKMEDLKARVC